MNNPDNELNEMLEGYLDGQLNDDQRQNFEIEIDNQPNLADSIALQNKIDDSLKRISAPPSAPNFVLPSLASLQSDAHGNSDGGTKFSASTSTANTGTVTRPSALGNQNSDNRSWGGNRRSKLWMTALLSSAAALVWLFVGMQIFSTNNSANQVAFQPVPLTEVYLQSINEGFQPYWLCEDPVTFANTFETRQGVPLKLEPLPENTQMLGLAYLSGLSRKSTSLLAKVDGKPVIVIIDRIDNDWGPLAGYDDENGIYVNREEKFGLVFYEVSQSANATVINFIGKVDSFQ